MWINLFPEILRALMLALLFFGAIILMWTGTFFIIEGRECKERSLVYFGLLLVCTSAITSYVFAWSIGILGPRSGSGSAGNSNLVTGVMI